MRQAVLALDLGTHCGWALLTDRVQHGRADFDAPIGQDGLRFQRFRAFLHETKQRCDLTGWPIGAVVFEQVDFINEKNGVKSIKVTFGMWAHLVAWSHHHAIRYRGISPGTIKKAVAGSGKASKPEVRAAVRASGFRVTDLNESDALGVLLCTEQYRSFVAAQKVAA